MSAFWRHAFFLQLFDGARSFFQEAHAHTFEHVRRLSELNVVIGNDFDPIAPRVAEIQALVDALNAEFFERPSNRLPVIDDKTEMALVIRTLRLAETQLDELIAEIDEGVVIALAAQGKVEYRAIKLERSVQIADFQDDVIDSQF